MSIQPLVSPLRRCILLCFALLALLVPAAARAADPEPGLVVSLPLSQQEVQRIQQSGVKVVRFFAYEHSTPVTDFDSTFQQLRAIGVKPIVVVVGDVLNPPVTDADVAGYASWLRQAAARYRGQVAGWEIWNEEDAGVFWAGASLLGSTSTDAGGYVRLLKAAHDAVKASDPAAPVVMGGVTGNDYRFVQSVYDDGGGPYFDVVSSHTDIGCNLRGPYDYYRDQSDGRLSQWVFLGYRAIHDVLVAHGDSAKPLWMTELGWSTSAQLCDQGVNKGLKAGGVSEADQATFLTQAFHCMAQDGIVQKAIVFRLADGGDGSPLSDFGLLRADGSAKPSFAALSTYAHRGDTLPASEQCGDFQGPSIAVSARYPADLHVHMSATDPSGVVFIDLFVDGKQVRHFFNGAMPATWATDADLPSARTFTPGRHTLLVRAQDFRGNVSTQTLVVVKGAAAEARAATAARADRRVSKARLLRRQAPRRAAKRRARKVRPRRHAGHR